ncbi:MAG: hypothetical protein HOM57_00785 [Gemmatimonadales bacterium]|nr:hypothetical protein [Gemmatimonadales bacterium]
MNRKYRSRSNGEVRSLIEEHWADLNTLGVLAYEVQHRFFMSRAYRANVVGRLLELMGSRLGALGGLRQRIAPSTTAFRRQTSWLCGG